MESDLEFLKTMQPVPFSYQLVSSELIGMFEQHLVKFYLNFINDYYFDEEIPTSMDFLERSICLYDRQSTLFEILQDSVAEIVLSVENDSAFISEDVLYMITENLLEIQGDYYMNRFAEDMQAFFSGHGIFIADNETQELINCPIVEVW